MVWSRTGTRVLRYFLLKLYLRASSALRSDKSTAHGKAHDEYVIDDPLWAAFIVNTSASLGLFLWEYFEKKYKPNVKQNENLVEEIRDEPINLNELPF